MIEDLSGKIYGKLRVITRDLTRTGKVFWICACECGENLSIRADHIKIRKPLYQQCRACQKNEILDNLIEKVKLNQPNLVLDYSSVDLDKLVLGEKIGVVCSVHGEFFATPNALWDRGCPICSKEARISQSLETFKEKVIALYGSKYDLSRIATTYKGVASRIIVSCKHGRHSVRASQVLRHHPCIKCSTYKTNEEYIVQAKEVHGNLYDYCQVEYNGSSGLLSIGCKKHGFFRQRATLHLSGSGCPKCQREMCTYDFVKKYTKFPEKGSEIGSIYLLRLKGNGEDFLKIGISSNLRKRLNNYRRNCPYSVEVIYDIKLENLQSSLLEREILQRVATDRPDINYKPLKEFEGWSECTTLDGLAFFKECLAEFFKSSM